jgi:hypothetical protein
MNRDQISIIKQLLYYDIFDHPLKREELIINCNLSEEYLVGAGILEEMTARGLICQMDGYFSMRNDPALIIKRKNGSVLAAAALPKALKMAKFISAFPFIRAVSISGSLSKNYMDEDKDVDFFIIVKPERLWLARTILILYKKIFLLNSNRYFCLNYFIDDEHLEIEQKNIFTATELFTLIPLTGRHYIHRFIQANSWVREYFKKYPIQDIEAVVPENKGSLKKAFEWMLNNRAGNALDYLAMNLTIQFWKKKYKNDPHDLFNNSFRLKRYIAKYHPENFQNLILEQYRIKEKDFEHEHHLSLD